MAHALRPPLRETASRGPREGDRADRRRETSDRVPADRSREQPAVCLVSQPFPFI